MPDAKSENPTFQRFSIGDMDYCSYSWTPYRKGSWDEPPSYPEPSYKSGGVEIKYGEHCVFYFILDDENDLQETADEYGISTEGDIDKIADSIEFTVNMTNKMLESIERQGTYDSSKLDSKYSIDSPKEYKDWEKWFLAMFESSSYEYVNADGSHVLNAGDIRENKKRLPDYNEFAKRDTCKI